MTAVLAPSASGQRCASNHLASCVCALPRWRGHGKKAVKSQRVPSYAGIGNVAAVKPEVRTGQDAHSPRTTLICHHCSPPARLPTAGTCLP